MNINIQFDNLEEMTDFARTLLHGSLQDTTSIKEVVKPVKDSEIKTEESLQDEQLLRLSLEEEAKELNVTFRSDIKTTTLKTRVEKAKAKAKLNSSKTTKEEVMEAAINIEEEDGDIDAEILKSIIADEEDEAEESNPTEEEVEDEEEDNGDSDSETTTEGHEDSVEVVEEPEKDDSKPIETETKVNPTKRDRKRNRRTKGKTAVPWNM